MSARPSTHYVPRGMSRVGRSPALIKAVVGAGYVVACHAPDFSGGGLLHLGCEAAFSGHAPRQTHAYADLVGRFTASLRDAGVDLHLAQAVIFGGADLLEVSPATLRDSHARARLSGLEELVRGAGIAVSARDLGGTRNRTVVLDLDRRCLRCEGPKALQRVTQATARPRRSASTLRCGENGPITVDIGCMHVDRSPAHLVAILGSCVGVALWDPQTTVGALAHVMLPHCPDGCNQWPRYADTAVSCLLGALRESGAGHSRLKAKLAGGAQTLFSHPNSDVCRVGENVVQVVREELHRAGIPVVGEDVGGTVGRKVFVDLATFRVRVKMLSRRRGTV